MVGLLALAHDRACEAELVTGSAGSSRPIRRIERVGGE
jgi:hypothetical protein